MTLPSWAACANCVHNRARHDTSRDGRCTAFVGQPGGGTTQCPCPGYTRKD